MAQVPTGPWQSMEINEARCRLLEARSGVPMDSWEGISIENRSDSKSRDVKGHTVSIEGGEP